METRESRPPSRLHRLLPSKIAKRFSSRASSRQERPKCILPECPLAVPRHYGVGYCAPHRCEDQNRDGTQCMAPCRIWRIGELVTPKSHIEHRYNQHGFEIPGKAKFRNGGGAGMSTDGSVYYRYALSPFCRFHEPERVAGFGGPRVMHHLKTYSSKASSLRMFYRRQMCLHADHGGTASTVLAFQTEDHRVEDAIVTIYPTCWEHLPEELKIKLAAAGLERKQSAYGSSSDVRMLTRSLTRLSGVRSVFETKRKRAFRWRLKDDDEDFKKLNDEMDWESDARSYLVVG